MSDAAHEYRDTWTIASAREEIDMVLKQVIARLEAGDWDETATFAVRLSLEEGLSNAMNHGNGGDPGRRIEVEFTGDRLRCSAVIVDEGPGYDPDSVPDPTAEENLTVASGRGLTLIRAFMTEVTVVAPGNRLEMTYVRPGE